MLPNTAMPKAPPNSAPVSEIPEAAPARSGGALPTMTSVARVPTGATPSVRTTEAISTAWRQILQVIGVMIIFNVGYYVVFTFLPTYFIKTLHFSKTVGRVDLGEHPEADGR